MTLGKSINLFLMDGEASGRIKCTLANWTGVAYKIPRIELDKCKEREDLKQSGVYFLFGVDEDTDENVVYIGQAGARKNGDGILTRLFEHKRNADKDYWTEAVVFTTSNNSFGPTEISYLENRFCGMANEAKRYVVKNGNEPTSGNITEEKESEMEEFIEYSKIIMGALGFKVFVSLVSSKKSTENNIDNDKCETDNSLELFLEQKSRKSGDVIKAYGRQTNEGFVVLSGSRIEPLATKKSIPLKIKNRRENAKLDENNALLEDMLFTSPSYASAFVIGGYSNGKNAWKTIDGKSLNDLEKE